MDSYSFEIMEKQDHFKSDHREMIEKLWSKEGTRYKPYDVINPEISIQE